MRPEESHREPGTFLGQIKKKGTESGDFSHCLYKPVCQNQPVGVVQPMGMGQSVGAGHPGREKRHGRQSIQD